MNLQQSIKRILKEDKDYTKLLKSIIDSSDVFDYKYFCGYDIIHPNERTDQYYFLNNHKIPFLIKVYFVGGPNSEVWPRTQAIRNKELDLMGDLREYITSLTPINIEMMSSHVNSCDGYKKLMKRKYTTDDLQESIKRILREETQGETPVEVILNALYPNFNKENASIKYVKSRFNRDVITYDDPETGYPFCSYWIAFRELTLEYELYETLEKYLNQDTFDNDLLNWFNSEFNKDAEFISF